MTDGRISQLTSLSAAALGDLLELLDVSDTSMSANGTNKKITLGDLITAVGVVRRYTALIGDGSSTSIAITQATHGLASNGGIIAAIYDAATGDQVFTDVNVNNSNGTVTFTFVTAPASNEFRIVLTG